MAPMTALRPALPEHLPGLPAAAPVAPLSPRVAAVRPPLNLSTRLALSAAESAAALGLSDEAFVQHVAPQLKVARCGRRKLYAVAELERWLAERAELALGDR